MRGRDGSPVQARQASSSRTGSTTRTRRRPARRVPVEQCADARCVLLRALQRSGTAFGLPEPLPPYVAIVLMRGRRRMYYSTCPELVTQTARSPHPTAHERASVRRVIDHGAKHNLSVLVTFSLPYPAAIDRVHYDVRTFGRSPEHGVRDGQLAYDPDKAAPCTVGGTLAASSGHMDAVLNAEEARFRSNVVAYNLDVEIDESHMEDRDLEKLRTQVTLLKTVAAKKEQASGEEVARMRRELEEARAEADKRVGEVTKGAERQREAQLAALQEANAKQGRAERRSADTSTELARLRAEKQGAEMVAERELEQLRKTNKVLAAEAQTAARRAGELEKAAARAAQQLAEEKRAHAEELRVVRADAAAELDALRASKAQLQQQTDALAIATERLSNEKVVADHQRAQSVVRRALLAKALKRSARAKEPPATATRAAQTEPFVDPQFTALEIAACALNGALGVQRRVLGAEIATLERTPTPAPKRRGRPPPPADLLEDEAPPKALLVGTAHAKPHKRARDHTPPLPYDPIARFRALS